MTYAPSELILQVLPSAIATGSWAVKIGQMTDKPDQQVVIYDSPGQTPDPKWLLDYPYVQVMVRGKVQDYQAAFAKMREVFDSLLGLTPQNVSGDRIDGITSLGSPGFVHYDENNRPVFSANFRMIVEPATSALTNREPL